MHDDLSTPSDDANAEQDTHLSTNLVIVPDDPEEPTEVMLQRDDAAVADLATEWITLDVDDLVDVEAHR